MNDKTHYQKGSSILEVLIAVAVLVFGISASIILVFANQSLKLDSTTSSEALYIAKTVLEDARATSRSNYASVLSDPTPITEEIYEKQLIVDPDLAAECSKQLEARVNWATEVSRPQEISLITRVIDLETARATGDCSALPPNGGGGITPVGIPINVGPSAQTNALDVLNRVAYIALRNDNLGFMIVDTNNPSNPTCYGLGGGGCSPFIPFANGYSSNSTVFDIDIARASNNRIYAYLARNSFINQFEVVDVTDPANPVSIVKKQLDGIPAVDPDTGNPPANSEGYRVFYHNGKTYITTRETLGMELHVFNTETPWDASSITEYSNPAQLNRTVNDLAVTNQNISGTDYTIAYLAADSNLKEVSAWDVTDPNNMTEISNSVLDLLGDYDVYSLLISKIRNTLYVGRQRSGPNELYAFDMSNPFNGLPEIAKTIVGETPPGSETPLAIRVSGPYLFAVSGNSGDEDLHLFDSDISVWSTSPDFGHIETYNSANNGVDIDLENHYLYQIMVQGSESLKIFYVP